MSEEKRGPGRPPKEREESVTLSKDQFDELMGRLKEVEQRAKASGTETTFMRYEKEFKKNIDADSPKKREQDMLKIQVVEQPATIDGEYVKDKCPACLKFRPGMDTILDLTLGGKYSCRRCGKHWSAWAIFPEDGSDGPLDYNILLERNGGEKEEYMNWKKIQDAKAGVPVTNIAK